MRIFLTAGAISGALAVLLGAFGAHLLKNMISPEMMEVYKTGVQYQFYHTGALLATGLLMKYHPTRSLRWAGYLFMAGMVIFSGFLYLLAVTGTRTLGMIVPVGGLALVAAWILMFAHLQEIKR